MKVRVALALAVLAVAILYLAFLKWSGHHDDPARSGLLAAATWQHMTMPGPLSKTHAFLENNCAACHTPVKGAEAKNCIACHANNHALLQRQETAFHADIQECMSCHREHRDRIDSPVEMNHADLTRIGLKQLQGGSAQGGESPATFAKWLKDASRSSAAVGAAALLSPDEAVLNCASCHGAKDKHFGFFGADCAKCHETQRWNIPEFRHPAPTSQSCASCHQPPASHYRSGFCAPPARLSQCYVCHTTKSWTTECAAGGLYGR